MAEEETSGWVGWIAFAAIILVLQGAFGLVVGIVALFQEDVYAVTNNDVWIFDYSAWGWIHIFWSVMTLFAALSLVKGNMPGRIFTVIVATIGACINMAFVPIYPIWSIMIVTIYVLVIWAVVVHGTEIKNSPNVTS